MAHRRIPEALAAAILLLLPGQLPADEGHVHGAPPERLGTVVFPVSCTPVAAKRFERGVALLHSFWYEEAEKSFRASAAADRQCAMAYWGIAMTRFHPVWAAGNPNAEPSPEDLKEGSSAVATAKALGGGSPRERDYIEAVAAYYAEAGRLAHPERARRFAAAMEDVHRRHPEDREAGIFHALALLGTVSPADKTYAAQKRAADILNRYLPDAPDHPGIAHYMIHSFDYPPLALLALPAARAYAKIAPDSPHALHMPSHIFTRLGLWEDSIASNLASSAAAQRHVAATHPGATSFDDLHAKDYLEYADLQTGRDVDAFQIVRKISAVGELDNPQFAAAYALAAIPARYAVERKDWALAASLPLPAGKIPWEKFSNAQAIARFARGLGAARSGRIDDAKRELEFLRSIRDALQTKGDPYWSGQAGIAALEIEAWVARAERRDDEALRLARSAADREDSTDKHPVTPGPVAPARELLADLLSDMNRPADALRNYEAVLVTSPGRFNALEGAGRCARAIGDAGKAKTYYRKLLEQCAHADGRQTILTEARAVAGS